MTNFKTVSFKIEENVALPMVQRKAMYRNMAFIAATSLESGRAVLRGAKYKRSKVEVSLPENTEGSSRMHALAGVIATMKEGIPSGEGIFLFHINKNLHDAISTGAFKQWIATGNFKNGSKVSKEELTLWAHFVDEYANCFERVEFRNIADASIRNKDNKVVEVTSEEFTKAPLWKQNNHKLAAGAWETVAATVGMNETFSRGEIVEVVEEITEDEAV
jgi:hypothetical protein